ncbi:g487 [Coccomyxa viridis]|uniref:G487 protein n=1 Tax=Coccomyxa viridis TaxID=1274662 RepID=A0ABP1FFU5_9CHLO
MASTTAARKGLAVSTSVLDSLVLEYMTSEGLIDFTDEALQQREIDEASRAKEAVALLRRCHAVRREVNAGRVEEAISMVEDMRSGIMKDQRLLYVMKTRKFLELLRPGTEEARKAALECLRKEVTPLAEVAYPEAYGEYKQTVIALAIGEREAGVHPAAKELWATHKRSDTAAMLSRTARQAAGLSYSQLSLILRYLVFVHGMLKEQNPGASELLADDRTNNQTIANLLGSAREPPPLPTDGPQTFLEADIQALKEAVQLTRHEAVQGLKHTHGDVSKAFTNELAALDLDVSLVDGLVQTYALQRELVQTSPSEGANAPAETDWDMEIDVVGLGSSPKTDVTTGYDRDGYSSPPKKIRRWLGRETDSQAQTPPTANQQQPRRRLPQVQPAPPGIRTFAPNSKHEQVMSIREQLEAGQFEEAMGSIGELAPGFLEANTDAAYMLLTARFYTMAADGKVQEAVPFARSHLAPLVKDNAARTDLMKNALADALLPAASGGALRSCINCSSISATITEALEIALGLQEPQLVQLLRVLLDSHKAWYRRQRCDDPFDSLLGLDKLKAAPGLAPPFTMLTGRRPVDADPAASSGSQASPDPEDLIEDEYEVDIMGLDGDAGAQQAQHASDDEEAAILLIMEFTGLGRPAAMDLLADSGGDAQTVLANLYQ